MEVIIRPTADAASELVAHLVADALRAKPEAVLGLATGRTMERLYAFLAQMHQSDGLDFSRVATFNLDEYIGLPPGSPHSYRHYMNEHLFRHVNIDSRRTYLPDGDAEDIDKECRRYDALIEQLGGIDLQLLGIGRTGHIGFNEPLSALRSRTRAKALAPQTIEQNRGQFGADADSMPHRAITMGVGTILDSRRCILLATGGEKASIIARAVEGPVTAMISASALQLHPHCTVVVDEAAAAELTQKDYYHWIFENEPEWKPYR